jgi:hypothetical protein
VACVRHETVPAYATHHAARHRIMLRPPILRQSPLRLPLSAHTPSLNWGIFQSGGSEQAGFGPSCVVHRELDVAPSGSPSIDGITDRAVEDVDAMLVRGCPSGVRPSTGTKTQFRVVPHRRT